jgi:DNA-binding CsgD family transcriptional regulator
MRDGIERRAFDALTEAAVDPGHWRSAAAAAMEYMGSSDIHFFSFEKSNGSANDLILRAPEAGHDWPHISQKCELLQYMTENPDYECFTDYDVLDENGIKKSEFYNWAETFDAKYRIGLRLLNTEAVDAGVAFLRSNSMGHATEHDLNRLAVIAPQLRLAARVSHALTGATIHLERLVESLALIRTAAVVLDKGGAIAFANDPARSILAQCDGIGASDRKLRLSNSRAQGRFLNAVGDALHASEAGDPSRPGGQLAVRRPSGLPPYKIIISSLPATDPFLDLRKPWALALIIDPAAIGLPTAEILRQGYHLTPMECDIAVRFAQGMTLERIADARGVTLGTVRVQFKGIMAKMGAQRQAELMRLLMLLSRS